MRPLVSILLVTGLIGLGLGSAQAGASLRVGTRVLVAGDSAASVVALLGKPSYTSRARAAPSRRSTRRRRHATSAVNADAGPGERWQYRRDGRVITVTLVDGRVTDIDERAR